MAEILRDRFADTAAAEPEVLAHNFTQAGMTDAAIEWWSKAGDQALRRSAFQEAIAHFGKAIDMADKESGSAAAAPGHTIPASERLKLQTSYGQAMMWSKGFGSEESKTAFARARQLAAAVDNPLDRFVTYYGQWANSCMRSDFGLATEAAETLLRETENAAWMPEAVTARRMLGWIRLRQGDFADARTHLEEALRIYDPQWGHEYKFRLGLLEPGLASMACLAEANWVLGAVERARELIEESVARSVDTAHVLTLANNYGFKAELELLRGDAQACLRAAEFVVELGRKHRLGHYLPMGTVYSGWAHARLGDRKSGMTELRDGLAAHCEPGNKAWTPFFQNLLAEIEAETESAEGALARVDEALTLASETGEHWSDALLHRLRGKILLKRDPTNPASAEAAFNSAIAIARQQKAKSFELQAALSLASLYQSSGRGTEAQAILGPALEGFKPTPEFPEIAEAQTLLAALA